MFIYYFLAFLICFSLVLNHGHNFSSFFFKFYRKLVKPKFKVGDRVMVDGIEVQILYITEHNPPYVYFCCPVAINNASIYYDPYISQYRMKAKTGIFKELD